MPVVNRGRLINFINGITGVSTGGNAVVNMPVNQRYHRNILQCVAINYTGGTGLAVTKITGSGTGATVTPTIVNGVVTGVTVVAGGSGWNVGDTFTFADATGTGFVGTVATVTGGPPGALATATVTVGGTPSPISVASLIIGCKQIVNGVNMRDINPNFITMISQANGVNPELGQLSLEYSSPWFNVNQQNEATSWDTFGQSTFQIQLQISPNVQSPGIVGISEFDYLRNVRPGANGASVPFLNPVSQHSFTWPIVAGRNDINQLPFSYPIERLWLLGSTPGNITQVEVYQDGNKIAEMTLQQMRQAYDENGFQFGRANWFNVTYPTSNTLKGQFEPPVYFDAAFISDPDQRWWKALACENSFVLRVYSAVAQNLTIVQEMLPGAFQA
jgi:hypothetical protein